MVLGILPAIVSYVMVFAEWEIIENETCELKEVRNTRTYGMYEVLSPLGSGEQQSCLRGKRCEGGHAGYHMTVLHSPKETQLNTGEV
jgi:hypothetical protein